MTLPLGRVVATERRPNTPHEFHFWTALDSPVGIGTIVRVDGREPVNGTVPRVYGVVTTNAEFSSVLNMTVPTEVSGIYNVTVANVGGNVRTFLITAAPISTQANKNDGTMTLDNTGAKTPAANW